MLSFFKCLLPLSPTIMEASFYQGICVSFAFEVSALTVGVINAHLYFQFSFSLSHVSVAHCHTPQPPNFKLGMNCALRKKYLNVCLYFVMFPSPAMETKDLSRCTDSVKAISLRRIHLNRTTRMGMLL